MATVNVPAVPAAPTVISPPVTVKSADVVTEPVTVNNEPLNVKFSSPFNESEPKNVAILLFTPFATDDTAPLPPPDVRSVSDTSFDFQ